MRITDDYVKSNKAISVATVIKENLNVMRLDKKSVNYYSYC